METWLDVETIPDNVPLDSQEAMLWGLICKPRVNGIEMVLDLTPLKEKLRIHAKEHGNG